MTNVTPTSRIEADVKAILNQGGDPAIYRNGLAERNRVSVDVVDAAIASISGSPRVVDAETLAQERLADDRRSAKQNHTTYRAANHKEE